MFNSFMIYCLDSGEYFRPGSQDGIQHYTNHVHEAGTWPSKESAIAWLEPVALDAFHYTIIETFVSYQRR